MSILKLCSLGLALTLGTLPQDGGEGPRSGNVRGGSQDLFGYIQAANEPKLANPASGPSTFYFVDQPDQGTGLSLAPLDDATRAHLKLPKGQGLVVTSVHFHSPAAMAGVMQNDILLSLGDSPLGKPEDLEEQLKSAGDKPQTLSLLRQGQKKSIKVQPQVSVTFGPVQAETPSYWIGVNVGDARPGPALAALGARGPRPDRQRGGRRRPGGQGGPQDQRHPADCGRTPLRDQAALVDAVQKNGDKPAALEIIREGSRQTIEVTPQKRSLTARFTREGSRPRDLSELCQLQSRPTRRPPFHQPVDRDVLPQFHESSVKPDRREVHDRKPGREALETMDGELKELRKAVEELTKVLKDRK